MDTPRTWELVLPRLEQRHEVLTPTLPGHAGGPPFEPSTFVDAVEQAIDEAGFETAHLAGNSLGGWLALQLAARGRARSVVALAPAGGWASGDDSWRDLLRLQLSIHQQAKATAPQAAALLSTPEGRRRATRYITVEYEHIPAELLEHQLLGVARCDAGALLDHALSASWEFDAAAIDCPVRVVWGSADALLPWPTAAARYRDDWLPQADWVVLDGVGHCPQLDVPLEAAELILGITA
jgi:pimeloyl-ACP methyl ester carboxylesterase